MAQISYNRQRIIHSENVRIGTGADTGAEVESGDRLEIQRGERRPPLETKTYMQKVFRGDGLAGRAPRCRRHVRAKQSAVCGLRRQGGPRGVGEEYICAMFRVAGSFRRQVLVTQNRGTGEAG